MPMSLKLSSPAEFMINLSIQNFIPFPVLPIPLRIMDYQGEAGTETKQDLVVPSQV